MVRPIRSLPTVQSWDCHSCGQCCKSYHVRVTAVEKARIEAQKWDQEPDGPRDPVMYDAHFGGDRLAHTAEGACVFLGEGNRCRIHAKFGAAAKPMACRVYPFVFVPAGETWSVGVRLGCPSAVENKGRPLAEHLPELREYAGLIEADAGGALAAPDAELRPGQTVNWPDLDRFVKSLAGLMADTTTPVEHRLRQVIAVAELCRKSRFEAVTGKRLDEFLSVIAAATAEDVPPAASVAPPGWLGRVIFRQVAAIYSRKDNGPHPGIGSRGRWTRVRAAWAFARGRGSVPRLHGLMPETNFAHAERPQPLTPEEAALYTRYYRLKLESLQFFGPTNARRPFWAGLDSLILTYPVARWLARVFAADPTRSRIDAARLALQLADDNFGYNPLLNTARQTWAVQRLSDGGELAKLVAWYGR